MFRISLHREPEQGTLIRMEGALDGDALKELQQVCGNATRPGEPIRLDLSYVAFADPLVLKFLREQERHGIELTNLPLLLRTQLDASR
jgi:hypothetical protein